MESIQDIADRLEAEDQELERKRMDRMEQKGIEELQEIIDAEG